MPDNFISAVRGYLRLGNFPLDASSVYPTQAEAETYVSSDPTAYAGQLIAVANENTSTVTVYQVGFGSGGSLELQSLIASQVGTVKSINGILPDENGNVTIDLDHLDLILTFLQDTPERVVFNKTVSVPTEDIAEDDDVITKAYLEASIQEEVPAAVLTFAIPKDISTLPTLTFTDARKTTAKDNTFVYAYDDQGNEKKISVTDLNRPSSFVVDEDPGTTSATSDLTYTKIGDFVYIKEE